MNALQRSQVVVEFSTLGAVLTANEMLLSLIGRKSDDVVGKQPSAEFFLDGAKTPWPNIGARLRGGEGLAVKLCWKGQNGAVWLHGFLAPVPEKSGQLAKAILFASDVTAQERASLENSSKGAAIERASAVIEFSPDGKILRANEQFCKATGYRAEEIVGQHHQLFVAADYARSAEYSMFWSRIKSGEIVSGKFQRFGKDQRAVWLEASYNLVCDEVGALVKVVKFATDITAQELAAIEARAKLVAIERSQGVIEFAPDGKILRANDIFLAVTGYGSSEIVGRHHSMFVGEAFAASAEYKEFWARLQRGDFVSDKFDRIGKNGKKICLQATYNPVLDVAGRVVKVVKFATDISKDEDAARSSWFKSASFDSSDMPMAVADSNFVITHVNEAMVSSFKKHIDTFKGLFPGFDPDKLVGQCIDVFHVDPSHQRKLLSSAEKLPYSRDTAIGDLLFGLKVSAIYDEKRRCAGYTMEFPDVTARRLDAGKLEAVSRSQAVVEYNTQGVVINANENFCKAFGYAFAEIKGKEHSMFVPREAVNTPEYREFWNTLRAGKSLSEKYLRIGRGGRKVWLQASYYPTLDANGRVSRVVMFATDVTSLEEERTAIEAEREAHASAQRVVVQHLAEGLGALASGDLRVRLTEPFPGEYEKLRHDYNAAMDSLDEAMVAVAGNVSGIRTGATELGKAADDLSRRTEQQAASLEQTSAALEEITATVRQTADGAGAANSVAADTRAQAEVSGRVVRDTVAAMAEIEKSSKQISQIIGVIDEIAFQTNLLALNAGVEAARAGDAGRGFAVVASEVRALAQRSSQAAKEIKDLISASSDYVETGVALVNDAGKALENIVAKVAEVSGLVSEIAASAKEQSTGLAEVNTAVNQMDQMTQQNAAMVEQSTAASHALLQEVGQLASMLGRFATRAAVGAPSAAYTPRANAPGMSVGQQKQRVAQFASGAKAASADWEEF